MIKSLKEVIEGELTDFYGHPLYNGLYFAGDGLDGDFYFIILSNDGKTFSAESLEGAVEITNHRVFAKQLIKLANPSHNLHFAWSKI